jgi:hypothetical protein
MSLLGKILALANILAAIGFIYLAASDYGKRQQWSYAVYRHDLALNGLPLDDGEKDVDGQPLVKNLTEATKTEMFQGSGQPVSTQLAELQRVQGEVRGKIDGEPMTIPNVFYGNPPTITLETPAQKRAWFLLPLARTLTERDALMTQLYSPKEETVTAEAFDKVFTDATAKQDAGDKRQAIATLLFGLLSATPPSEGQQDVLDSPGYKRFVTVVGRQAAARAVDNQADALAQLALETDDALTKGRLAFAAAHGRLVSRLRELNDAMDREKTALESQQNQTARQQELVNERQRQVKDLEARLDAARKRTRTYLAEQQKLQQALLAEERKLRDANSENRKLVGEIEKLEK